MDISKEVVFIWALPVLTILAILAIIFRIVSVKKHYPSSEDTTSDIKSPDPSCSSSSSSPPTWDVFLSFHGKDTRSNFTSHLYHALCQAGIQTFIDDHALEKGQEISSTLLDAIRNSDMFIVVLSENYASSPWCLDELAEILSCKRTEKQVVPVFYYVDPSDVGHQKGSFGKAFDSRKKRYSVDRIKKWKSALSDIAKLSGHHLRKEANEKESETIQKIVGEVAPQASTKELHLEKYLSGIETAVEEIYQKLNVDSDDVRAIGICGMGGIGKTTIAKSFYNLHFNKFDISCFSVSVKQYLPGGSTLLQLLQQLLIDLLRKNDYKVSDVESGIRKLKRILHSKKALIVLDDLDCANYSELLANVGNLFSAGSKIVITTRDANLLDRLKADISEVDTYEVKPLGHIESMELFSYHAFRNTVPPESFKELSLSFVTHAGGLPLALKVLGSSLLGSTQKSFWKDKLEKVKAIPENDIQKILQLSYDDLDDETEKAIFLEIVFFFVGEDKDDAVRIFESCNFYPGHGIKILQDRCLITVDEWNKLQMHNLIQDMGRKIAGEEFKGKYLHLYQENACETLQNLEGAEHIELLVLDLTRSRGKQMTAKIFKRMSKLRLLEIVDPHKIIMGYFKNYFPELRCMRWRHCPWTRVHASFCPPKLVSLDMSFNQLNTFLKLPASLKSLNVSYSKLKTIPNLSDLKVLERLLLHGCQNLSKVPPTISQLSNLDHLDMGRCLMLKELPESIGQLTLLTHFNLSRCVNLNQLPETITHLTRLNHLELDCCYNLKRLPERMGNMQGLITFHASWSGIEQLPDSFGELIKLVDLNLFRCKNLSGLPDSICKLMLLKVLGLEGSHKLKRLPEELGKMQSLERLYAGCEQINELPDSIGQLSSLQVLSLSACRNLRYLPGNIWNLTSLHSLHFPTSHGEIIDLPERLKTTRLENLNLSCNIRLWLPKIQSFSSLKRLSITDESQSFSTEPLSLLKLSNLLHLILRNHSGCGPSFYLLPLNLQELWVYDNATLEQLPDLSRLKCLRGLIIRRCISLRSLPPLPPHLQSLKVDGCTKLQGVPDLSMLKELKELSFFKCSNLKSISLKESSLQATRLFSFRAHLLNRMIPEWFNYTSRECKLSFQISPALGDNFLGIALWVVYKCKETRSTSNFRAVMTNKTKATRKDVDIEIAVRNGVELRSVVQCIRAKDMSVESGDRITVSIERILYCSSSNEDDYEGIRVPSGKVEVETWGAHILHWLT